jgi:hypothetical protein
MGTSLINTKPKNNYGSLIKVGDNLPIDGTLKTISDGAGNDTPLQLSLTEVQVNSIFRINTNNTELLDIQDVGGNNRFNINRNVQKINLDFSSNPASSTELIGAIRTYADGVNLSDAISFIKDGSIGMGTQSPVGLLHLKKTGATTRLAIDGDAGQSRILSYRTGGVQRFGLYTNNTAETGSNVGSDFALRAYSDAGTLLSTPFFIKRSTGNVGINQTSPTSKLNVVGNGSTSATSSIICQNSLGTQYFKVADNGEVSLGTQIVVGNAGGGSITGGIGGRFQIQAQFDLAFITAAGGVHIGATGGSPVSSALLQVQSNNKGFLPPRLTTVQKNAIASPASGLIVYDSTLNKLCVFGAAAWETITSI